MDMDSVSHHCVSAKMEAALPNFAHYTNILYSFLALNKRTACILLGIFPGKEKGGLTTYTTVKSTVEPQASKKIEVYFVLVGFPFCHIPHSTRYRNLSRICCV